MILHKPFYFLRHGQTDHNVKLLLPETEENPPLNALGQSQASSIASLVRTLEIDTICHSPLQRAIETMLLCTEGIDFPMHHVEELKECTSAVWLKMIALQEGERLCPIVQPFFEQVACGVNVALACGEAVLIVAHGGVHWALCHMLQMSQHDWDLDNCGLVHFSPEPGGHWSAKLLHEGGGALC